MGAAFLALPKWFSIKDCTMKNLIELCQDFGFKDIKPASGLVPGNALQVTFTFGPENKEAFLALHKDDIGASFNLISLVGKYSDVHFDMEENKSDEHEVRKFVRNALDIFKNYKE